MMSHNLAMNCHTEMIRLIAITVTRY